MSGAKVSSFGYDNCKIDVPTLEDLYQDYGEPPPATTHPPGPGEVVAMGACSYAGYQPQARDSHCRLAARMAVQLGAENLWVLHSKPRMPFPYAPLYAVAGMFMSERQTGRKADWFFWLDDDVIVRPDCYELLRKAANAETRPFVSAVALDRHPPFRVATWNQYGDPAKTVTIRKQWVAPDPETMPEEAKYKLRGNEMWMPASGVHEVTCTGLCAAIFHRSLFEKIPQPWFAVLPGATDPDGNVAHKVNPDSWWCQQLGDHGVKIHVSADVQVVHLGAPVPVSVGTAWALRKVFPGQ